MPKSDEVTILESECRNYASTSATSKYRTRSEVMYSDFTLALPRASMADKAVLQGDKVYVEGYLPGITLIGEVAAPGQVNNLGANIWYNKSAN